MSPLFPRQRTLNTRQPLHGNQVRSQDLLDWLVKHTGESQRLPAPADTLGALKLRGVDYLREEFDKVAAAGGVQSGGAEVGWRRNPEDVGLDAVALEEPGMDKGAYSCG